jgi:hypothetical protein
MANDGNSVVLIAGRGLLEALTANDIDFKIVLVV